MSKSKFDFWKCDWCKKDFLYAEHDPCQTVDNGTICSECFEADEEGPRIAEFGLDQYYLELENEAERVVDVDGRVDYQ